MASVAPRSTTLGLKGTKGQPHKLRSFACVKPSVSRTVVSAQQQDGSAETSTSGRSEATVASSRKMPYGAILALSSLGLGETVYLTAAKITNGTVACPLSEGCADILTSSYASFMGVVPLASLGVLAYGGVAALAAHGLFFAEKDSEAADRRFRTTLLTGGAVLASCSGYLMYLLLTKFSGEWCPWCIASALLSFSIAGLAASGMRERELQDAAGPELGLVASTLLVLSLGLGNPGVSDAEDMVLPYREPEITSDSTKRTMQLSRRLAEAGAKMYGAFWCSHCYDQKEGFGAQAMKDFPYVECFPEGWQRGTQMAPACQSAGLEGFPTWVIGEKKLVGQQSLEQLEEALSKAVEDVAALGMP